METTNLSLTHTGRRESGPTGVRSLQPVKSGLGRLLAPTDPAIIEAGAGGERFVARARVVFWSAVDVIPVAMLLTMAKPMPEVWISFAASSLACLMALVLERLVRRYRDVPWVPFATVTFDVSLITATLVTIALVGRPVVAVNSHAVWPIYLLAIAATALRLDLRVCLMAGIMSAAQYLAVVVWVASSWDVTQTALLEYGQFSWPTQIAKVLLLLVGSALTSAIILQTRRFAQVSGNDRLTGLGNRALFDEKMRIEMTRARRGGLSLSLAFVDIDHFKDFNDRWGHETGDRALGIVADILRGSVRASDSAFRWGGEEMLVLLPETDAAGAVVVLERIREALKASRLPSVHDDVRIRISAGIAEFPREAATTAELLRLADHRLMAAKQAGRDRIVAGDEATSVRRVS